MKKSLAFGIVVAFALVICAGPALAAVEWPEKWWPSKWGAGDERGSFNTVTPKSVMKALNVPKTGKIYRLGRLYKHGMPLFGSRTYALHIPGLPAGGPLGDNQIVWNDEFIVGELGQVGTPRRLWFSLGLRCRSSLHRVEELTQLGLPVFRRLLGMGPRLPLPLHELRNVSPGMVRVYGWKILATGGTERPAPPPAPPFPRPRSSPWQRR